MPYNGRVFLLWRQLKQKLQIITNLNIMKNSEINNIQSHSRNTGLSAVLSNLKVGDYIAFQWNYGIFGKEIIVDNISCVEDEKVLVHFLYGYKSEGEWVEKSDIIAIGDMSANGKIKGWSGNFNILLPNHELLSK